MATAPGTEILRLGTSSLGWRKRFPGVTPKSDKSFVEEMGNDPECTARVAGQLSPAFPLSLKGPSEGLGTVEKVKYLQQLMCDQGRATGPPEPRRARQWSGSWRAIRSGRFYLFWNEPSFVICHLILMLHRSRSWS